MVGAIAYVEDEGLNAPGVWVAGVTQADSGVRSADGFAPSPEQVLVHLLAAAEQGVADEQDGAVR